MLRFLRILFFLVIALGVVAAGSAYLVLQHYARDLPDYQQLAAYDPPMVTRVHAGDGRLLAEYAIENRVFVPISAIPKRLIDAFLAAEDKNFYSHPGIDIQGIVRATVQNALNFGSSRRPVGASTITQQVAKNFLLTNEVSFERKIKEAILAYRIEQTFSKDRILELYLNEIYLGFNSYGVASAALNYFNRSLDDLSLAEAAFIAALPKAPNNYNPQRRPEAAKARRDYVLERMAEDGLATREEVAAAIASPIEIRSRTAAEAVRADVFAEEVRRELMRQYGEKAVYRGGLSVRTTLDPVLQTYAETAFREGIVAYDRRHGWRGPVARIALDGKGDEWKARLAAVPAPPGLAPWTLAAVLTVGPAEAVIGLPDGGKGRIPLDELRWARETKEDQRLGPAVRTPADVLAAGDVVAVERAAAPAPQRAPARGRAAAPAPEPAAASDRYALRQIPNVSGGFIALDPHTGRVLAMIGGFSFEGSQFNRATQAMRQPGSSFKPFVYTAALETGMPPNTIILDEPVVFDPGGGQERWKPGNSDGKFLGAMPMRIGIERSRNLMTVRLAERIGMGKVADVARRFGVFDDMQPVLALSLGAGETTLMRMASAYAIFVNGGKKVTATLIDRVQDREGKTIFRHDARECPTCRPERWSGQAPPVLPDPRPQVVDPQTAYQMVSMLEGVVLRGTAARAAALRRPLAGKTGTTNDAFDAWFVGFSPDLVVATYVGFDRPRTLGPGEQGGSTAVPIFTRFMEQALKDKPVVPFRVPSGLRLVRIDRLTGQPAGPGDPNTIMEAFKPGTEPTADVPPQLSSMPGGDPALPAAGGPPGAFAPPPRPVVPAAAPSGIY
ncbi:MAG: penicillin-binding protein 1A [Alphaproteobacteria bacterium]|nr:penicillin-binding protein 1A [Alphaproteobacteria bacterium]